MNRLRNLDSHTLFLIFMIVFYSISFSYITVSRIYALQTYAYDLGVYNQALHTTLTGKGLLYYTSDLQANPPIFQEVFLEFTYLLFS